MLFTQKYDRLVVFLQKPMFDAQLDAIRLDALYTLAKMYELYNSDLQSWEVLQECIEVAQSNKSGRYYFLTELQLLQTELGLPTE